jgi:hypothetical protein
MFDKEIEFSAHEDYFSVKEDYPIPTKLNIPDWFKNLEHSLFNKTVKGCMPFLDSITSGYLLKMPQDLYINHNVNNENQKKEIFKDSFNVFAMEKYTEMLNAKYINLNCKNGDVHPTNQLLGSPLIEKNKNLPFYKILNPWKIKTPKGYSCLFVPPLNNSDDRFSIIPGIVDTDTFPMEINFPMTINGDKYPVLTTVIKKGTPYVQIIPFKRDKWKMKTTSRLQKEIINTKMFFSSVLIDKYKKKFWSKKSWR